MYPLKSGGKVVIIVFLILMPVAAVPWSPEEHRSFLIGLEKCGKGAWRQISREFVKTRTPSQVASHAQKFFIRQQNDGKNKERRRASIHDLVLM